METLTLRTINRFSKLPSKDEAACSKTSLRILRFTLVTRVNCQWMELLSIPNSLPILDNTWSTSRLVEVAQLANWAQAFPSKTSTKGTGSKCTRTTTFQTCSALPFKWSEDKTKRQSLQLDQRLAHFKIIRKVNQNETEMKESGCLMRLADRF